LYNNYLTNLIQSIFKLALSCTKSLIVFFYSNMYRIEESALNIKLKQFRLIHCVLVWIT